MAKGLLIAAIISLLAFTPGQAAEIVALGASNTAGRGQGKHPDGVSRDKAYPAQLQALLAQAGCRVKVLNAGIAGDTTGGMLARMRSSVGPDTKVLILQPGGNDGRKGATGRGDNIEAIRAEAARRHIKVVMIERLNTIAGDYRLGDGQHYSEKGHALFARYLLPKVRDAGICR